MAKHPEPASRKGLTYGLIGAAVLVVIFALLAYGERQGSDVTAAGNPSLGDGDLILYLFEDYECSHCADYALSSAFQHLLTTWVEPGHVTLVFKHVAFVDPSSSDDAARASRCVHDVSPASWLAWDHEVYQRNDETRGSFQANEENLFSLTRDLGTVDMDAYRDCMKDDAALDAITATNQDEFRDAGIGGTPGLLVGVEVLNPGDTDAVDAAIQRALDEAEDG